jgi:hypothetical protein
VTELRESSRERSTDHAGADDSDLHVSLLSADVTAASARDIRPIVADT